MLSLSKRQNSLNLKDRSEFKDQIVSKFDLGLLNAYNPMYFDRNISENKNSKINEGSYLSCVTNGEFYFITITRKGVIRVICFSNENSKESSGFQGIFQAFEMELRSEKQLTSTNIK